MYKKVYCWVRDKDQQLFHQLGQWAEKTFSTILVDIRKLGSKGSFPVPRPLEYDGLLLTGGEDISKEYLEKYGKSRVENADLIQSPCIDRDQWEFNILEQTLKNGKPVLGICRGIQLLNTFLGGTLHLDIPGHNEPEQHDHNIQQLEFEDVPSVRFPLVNSSHHQAIDRVAEGLRVEARAKKDGIIEQVRLKAYPFCIGVQYHPERDLTHYESLFHAFFSSL
ncbi:type 1 glutamine amidotransferase [Methylacidiphilum caldifontis]|uniref:gamma-glutamyl-gamma-aminobutyrate hydrolase family protein n=1 Tax=Methylacidiphilum caldifontis TaxID=2795386 RepID=UPI001A8EB757|nr:type 1 glutamine amidotransferase [Methylacidiphilum caldifontis]QSR89440.1 type 1 glutamine amidotransferase [Methylacidiphilum caldifontis]